MNSALHSYLIVSYAREDGVSLDVGFYYMANALGRLVGTVLGLMAEGRSNVAIAEELVVSAGAVEKHVRNIFTKLDLPPDPDDHRRVLAVLRYLGS